MKIRTLFAAAAAAMTLASCHRAVPMTELTILVPEGESFQLVSHDIDTVYSFEGTEMHIFQPTYLQDGAYFITEGGKTAIAIFDGTHLTVNLNNGSVTSNKPKKSVQESFNQVNEFFSQGDPDEKTLMSIFKKNSGNVVGAMLFGELAMNVSSPEELKSLHGCLSKELRESEYVQSVMTALEREMSTATNAMFSDFTVKCLVADGDGVEESEVSLSDYVGRGKYMLVDFWASWCGPCRDEIPVIRQVYEKYAGNDFDVLSIAVSDVPDDTFRTADECGICWNQIVPMPENNNVPAETYGIQSIPQIFLFGPDGTILARNLRGAAIEEEVAKYVKAK